MAAHKRIAVVIVVGVLVLCSLWLANTVGAQGEVSFIAPRDFRVGEQPFSVAVGDFNGDGHLDVATANANSNTVSIRLGRGDGTFQAAPDVGMGAFPSSVAAGEFNGDGRPDLVVANGNANTVSILPNNTPGVVVNDFVTFEPLGSTFHFTSDPAGCPTGFAGKFSFEARLTNVGERSLSNLTVAATRLAHFNLLQNADGGPGGIGARVAVPREDGFANGVLSPKEFVDVPLIVCLLERQPFRFEVAVLGVAE